MAKVLVTGATGFIAGHVIHQLLEAGHEVIGTARSASKAGPLNQTLSAYAGKPVSIQSARPTFPPMPAGPRR